VEEARRALKLPPVEHADYEKNFVRTAVCELRFPALLELETRPPDALQKALRKDFPLYQKRKAVTGIMIGGDTDFQLRHHFESKEKKWTVAFHSSSIALETTAYRGFLDFEERLGRVLKAVEPIIDADFFTRVGLRYINALPYTSAAEFEGWVNPELAGTLVKGPFGDVAAFWQEARGVAERGSFSFRHGLAEADSPRREYILDFDFYDENVEVGDVPAAVKDLHDASYRLFRWAAGPKTIEALGQVVTRGAKK